MLNVWLFLICYNIKEEDLIDEMRDSILKKTYHSNYQGGLLCKSAFYVIMDLKG